MKTKLFVVTAVLLSGLFFTQGVFAQTCCSQNDDVFPDVAVGHEYYDQINYLHREEVFLGADDGNFYPDATLNRAEFAAIAVRLSGATPDVSQYHDCFPDVTEGWYEAPVCYAKTQGWVKGYEGGEMAGLYGPANKVMDIETIVILSRFFNWPVEESDSWYAPALNFAITANIYDAQTTIVDITREKTADVMFRALATTPLGHNEYTDELKEDVYTHSISELVDVTEQPIEIDTENGNVNSNINTNVNADREEYESAKPTEDSLVHSDIEDHRYDPFYGEAGKPQMFACSPIFNPMEGIDFQVQILSQVAPDGTMNTVKSVKALLYDMTSEDWVYGRNTTESMSFIHEKTDGGIGTYGFLATSIYNPATGIDLPLVHVSPQAGYLLEVETNEGSTFILGKDETNQLDPSLDIQTVADDTTPNDMGDDITAEKKCPPVDVLGALQGAFTAEGVSIDTSNLDTSNFQSPMECGGSVTTTIRLNDDLEVLPSHEEIGRQVAAGNIPEGGFKVADYLLVIKIWSYCNTQTWECEVTVSYSLIRYHDGVIIGSGYKGWTDKDNLQGEFDTMLDNTESAVSTSEGSPQQLH